MCLKHRQTGESPYPIDVSEPRCRFLWHRSIRSVALHYRAMSRIRQLSVWVAFGLWAAVVTAAAIYGAWHGYADRAFVSVLGVLAFFLAIQLLFAAENLGEQWARRVGSHRGVLLAVVPFLAY